MTFIRKYNEMMRPLTRVSRGDIKPLNIYRISTYRGSKPITKTGDDTRFVFVIGKVGGNIHCIKLNEIPPIDFTRFINKIRDKRIPIKQLSKLNELLKKFKVNGSDLFEGYVKNNPRVYHSNTKRTYRIYKLDSIVNVWEVRFEIGFLRNLFGERDDPMTTQEQREVITDEVNEHDKNI